jgi:hypothetical protein
VTERAICSTARGWSPVGTYEADVLSSAIRVTA